MHGVAFVDLLARGTPEDSEIPHDIPSHTFQKKRSPKRLGGAEQSVVRGVTALSDKPNSGQTLRWPSEVTPDPSALAGEGKKILSSVGFPCCGTCAAASNLQSPGQRRGNGARPVEPVAAEIHESATAPQVELD